ncbi:MAG: hypothetical protein AAGE52_18990 [Myxococcota bacterium]
MRRLGLWGLILGLAFGCGDDDGGGADDGGGRDAPADIGGEDTSEDVFIPGDAGPTVTWMVRARDLLTGDPVVTANICVRDVPAIECLQVDETTAEGEIQVPVGAEIQLVSNAIRYFPQLNTYVTDDMPRTIQIDMGKRGNIEPLIGAAGVTVDETKGQLAFLAQSGPGTGIEGVTATLMPVSGMGPFYTMDSLPSLELSATSDDGLGVFTNVDPGRVEVVYNNPGGDCEPNEGWPGSAAGSVATELLPGHLTIILARCPLGEMDAGVDAAMDADAAADAGADAGT